MSRITISTVTTLLALFCLVGSAQAGDSKIYSGSDCRQTGWVSSNTSEYRYGAGAVYNGSSNYRTFVCPVIRDQTQEHLKKVSVHVSTSGSRTVYCRVINSYGSPSNGSGGSYKVSTRSGSRKMDLGGIGTSSFTTTGHTYSIQCVLPNTGSISMYQADEN